MPRGKVAKDAKVTKQRSRNQTGSTHGCIEMNTDREKDRHEFARIDRNKLRERKIFDEMRDFDGLHCKEHKDFNHGLHGQHG